MSRNPALVLFTALALIAPASAFAQLTPPAGSAGAGNSSISGVPFGPANPRALSDPSGIGNASSVPPLRPNPPAPVTSYGSVDTPAPRARLATPPYAGASQRIFSAAPSLPAKAAGSAAGATGDEQFHRDLPGVLAIKLRFRGDGGDLARGRAFQCPATARNNFLLPNLFKVGLSGHAC